MQTYEELVALGKLWEWDVNGEQVARAERFNTNVQTAIEQAIQAYLEAKAYADGIVVSKADKATSLAGYGIADALTKDEIAQAINTAIQNLVGLAPSELDTMKEIADAIILSDSNIQGILTALSSKAALSQVYERTVIDTKLSTKADKDTTLSGYGITDATPSSHVGATGTAHGVATTSVNGFMSNADKSKLDGIASGAQVNTVTSVAGKTGAVTLAKADVGLGSVDNTADSAKNVLSATKLTTARTITIAGDMSGSANFDGSSDISITATISTTNADISALTV